MSRIPQDILDDLAAFAAGLRPWSEWSSWLAGHAYRLAPVIDRPRFREIKATPPIGVAEMFRDEGIAILPSESRFPGMPREPVSSIEYEVYTAVCKQKDLFRFHLPDTTFEDQTNPDTFEHSRRRMAFDERRREYRIIEPSLIG
ncbi:MAG: hypothetical protein K8T89_25975, partial [Planctomycetes bacterium]|nr:hypothetical protein [Planctomycetota bacterium]